MISGYKRECDNCAFFRRYSKETDGNRVIAVTSSTDPVPVEDAEDLETIAEFGKCVRFPPQFFYETINGEWPVVHQSHYCGEHRADDSRTHWN